MSGNKHRTVISGQVSLYSHAGSQACAKSCGKLLCCKHSKIRIEALNWSLTASKELHAQLFVLCGPSLKKTFPSNNILKDAKHFSPPSFFFFF